MLIIRLSRTGKKNQPHYRVVLAEKTYPIQGKFIELLGSYNPHQKNITLKEKRIKHWIGQGVAFSDTVHNLLIKKGVIKAPKIKRVFKSKSGSQDGGASQDLGAETEKSATKKETADKEENQNPEPAKEEKETVEKETSQ